MRFSLCPSPPPESEGNPAARRDADRSDAEVIRPVRNQGEPGPGRRAEEPIRIDNDRRTLAVEHLDEVACVADWAKDDEMTFAPALDEDQGRALDRRAGFRQGDCIE